MGARAVEPWLGEQKPLGKSPLRGNPSPETTYLPTLSPPTIPGKPAGSRGWGAPMGTFRDFGNLGFVATWGLARFCGPCPADGFGAKEVLRMGTWTPSAIPPGEETLI